MRIDVTVHDGTTTIKPHGRLDAAAGSMMQDTLLRVANSGTDAVLLNLSAVPAISSAGLAPCVHPLAHVMKRSSCKIEGMKPHVEQFLERAGILRLIELHDSLQLHNATHSP